MGTRAGLEICGTHATALVFFCIPRQVTGRTKRRERANKYLGPNSQEHDAHAKYGTSTRHILSYRINSLLRS